jgi:cytochrome P450
MDTQWALIELCRKPEKQQKLREELAQFVGSDPTFDQLSTGLPYLDAISQEVLRLHPPVHETTRVVRMISSHF